MSDETPAAPLCSKCGENPAGAGGVLCPPCLAAIAAQTLPAP